MEQRGYSWNLAMRDESRRVKSHRNGTQSSAWSCARLRFRVGCWEQYRSTSSTGMSWNRAAKGGVTVGPKQRCNLGMLLWGDEDGKHASEIGVRDGMTD